MILALISPLTVKVGLKAAEQVKKHWPKILILVLLVLAFPFIIFIALISSMFSFLNWGEDEPERHAAYQQYAQEHGLAWMDLVAVDAGLHRLQTDEMNLESIKGAFVYETQEDFPVYKKEKVCIGKVCNWVDTNEIDYYDTRTVTKTRTFEEAMAFLNFDAEQRELAIEARDELAGGDPDGGDDGTGGVISGSFTPCEGYTRITSNYGYRIHPISGVKKYHAGIDIGCPIGTPVLSYHSGVVSVVGWDADGYGNWIEVQSFGLKTRYAHLDRTLVKRGDTIEAGQKIALSGNTGGSTGPHLHFEVFVNGSRVDPLTVLTFET